MNKIWKFPFEITDDVVIEMPEMPLPLSVQVQDGKPTIWAIVNPEAPKVKKRFFVYGTGHPINDEGKAYLGTIQHQGFVWHVFF